MYSYIRFSKQVTNRLCNCNFIFLYTVVSSNDPWVAISSEISKSAILLWAICVEHCNMIFFFKIDHLSVHSIRWQLFQLNNFIFFYSCQLTAAFPKLTVRIRFSIIYSWTKHTISVTICRWNSNSPLWLLQSSLHLTAMVMWCFSLFNLLMIQCNEAARRLWSI
jgi:hypothetical protein